MQPVFMLATYGFNSRGKYLQQCCRCFGRLYPTKSQNLRPITPQKTPMIEYLLHTAVNQKHFISYKVMHGEGTDQYHRS